MSNKIQDLAAALSGAVEVKGGRVLVHDEPKLRASGIDTLVFKAVFGDDAEKSAARWLIWEIGQTLGVRPASIHELYVARGRNAIAHNFTTPAMNIRMASYDTARAAIRAALKKNVGAFIFEIARSEMTYTQQPPQEFTTVMLAAAIKEGFRGPLFIQGDHFQINAKKYAADSATEIAALKKLMDDAIAAGYYNIDIDTSTLVDLSKSDLDEQQHMNYELCAMFSDYIRSVSPAGVTISLGGEIGEVGHKNSDVHEARAFMDGYKRHLKNAHGISKLSVNTGTSHGGTVLPDGRIADVSIDFTALHDLSVVSRHGWRGAARREHAAGVGVRQVRRGAGNRSAPGDGAAVAGVHNAAGCAERGDRRVAADECCGRAQGRRHQRTVLPQDAQKSSRPIQVALLAYGRSRSREAARCDGRAICAAVQPARRGEHARGDGQIHDDD